MRRDRHEFNEGNEKCSCKEEHPGLKEWKGFDSIPLVVRQSDRGWRSKFLLTE